MDVLRHATFPDLPDPQNPREALAVAFLGSLKMRYSCSPLTAR
jgi:hypothetical protein